MYQCSECGRVISSKMHGKCMACRYAEIRRRHGTDGNKKKTVGIRLRVDPSKLPKPPRPATKEYRGFTAEDMALKRLYEATKRQEKLKARFEGQNRKKQYHPHNYFTAEEDEKIREMIKAGSSIKEIAESLGRPYPSIVGRKKRLQEEDRQIKKILEELLE